MRTSLFAIIVLVLASRAAFSAPEQGDLRESAGKLRVWHTAQQSWVSPETFFQLELRRLNGPTYGSITEYPPYSSVKEWETLGQFTEMIKTETENKFSNEILYFIKNQRKKLLFSQHTKITARTLN